MPSHKTGPIGRQRVLTGLALTAAVAGIVALAGFFITQDDPPRPTSSDTVSPSTGRTRGSGGGGTGNPGQTDGNAHSNAHSKAQGKTGDKPLPASKPTNLSIPTIDVHSEVVGIGKTPDGALAVPAGKDINKAAWYKNSVTPGQPGPAVLEGHIDTVDGPSVFYRLAAVEPGDTVKITRVDGSRVVFTVTGVRAYPSKDAFPAKLVYGGNLTEPSLRLITCANFDHSTGHYAGNTVVYANLTAVHKA